MSDIALTALHSDDSLGVLAALGILELLSTTEGIDARLGWDGLGGAAVLRVDLPDAAAVAERLRSVALRLQADGRLVPADPSLTPPRWTTAERRARKATGIDEMNDPMRGSPAIIRDRLRDVARLEHAGDAATARWAVGLLTMLGVDRAGSALMTPLYAPAGQQVLGQILGHYLAKAAEPGMLEEALVAWRRRPDSGANLDYRDLRDGAFNARGVADNAAVPGATWLALMSIPLFRQSGDGVRGEALSWQRVGRAVRPRKFVWPVWAEPRSLHGVEALLSHPAIRSIVDTQRDHRGTSEPARLRGLGVVAVCSASRRPLGKADGPLQATQVEWP